MWHRIKSSLQRVKPIYIWAELSNYKLALIEVWRSCLHFQCEDQTEKFVKPLTSRRLIHGPLISSSPQTTTYLRQLVLHLNTRQAHSYREEAELPTRISVSCWLCTINCVILSYGCCVCVCVCTRQKRNLFVAENDHATLLVDRMPWQPVSCAQAFLGAQTQEQTLLPPYHNS